MIFDSQVSYAQHRGISQARVNKLIQQGKIPKNCLKIVSGRQKIIRDKADEALLNNLNPIYVQKRDAQKAKQKTQSTVKTSPPTTTSTEPDQDILSLCVDAKKQALAAETEQEFYNVPMLSMLRYIVNLYALKPELVKQSLVDDGDGCMIEFPDILDDLNAKEYFQFKVYIDIQE